MFYVSLHTASVCLGSVVGVDVCLIFILAALLEALLLGPVLLPVAGPGRAGRGPGLVAVAGGTAAERHPRVEVRLLPLQQLPVRPDTQI